MDESVTYDSVLSPGARDWDASAPRDLRAQMSSLQDLEIAGHLQGLLPIRLIPKLSYLPPESCKMGAHEGNEGGGFQMNSIRSAITMAFALAFGVTVSSTVDAADGKAIFLGQKCNLCHTIDSQGIAKTSDKIKAPDLSNASGLVESADWLKSFLKKEVKKDDKNHLREFKGTAEELDAVVQWLVTLKKT